MDDLFGRLRYLIIDDFLLHMRYSNYWVAKFWVQ